MPIDYVSSIRLQIGMLHLARQKFIKEESYVLQEILSQNQKHFHWRLDGGEKLNEFKFKLLWLRSEKRLNRTGVKGRFYLVTVTVYF